MYTFRGEVCAVFPRKAFEERVIFDIGRSIFHTTCNKQKQPPQPSNMMHVANASAVRFLSAATGAQACCIACAASTRIGYMWWNSVRYAC
jgi:hypothetical protein